jgi:hypothetical protein
MRQKRHDVAFMTGEKFPSDSARRKAQAARRIRPACISAPKMGNM